MSEYGVVVGIEEDLGAVWKRNSTAWIPPISGGLKRSFYDKAVEDSSNERNEAPCLVRANSAKSTIDLPCDTIEVLSLSVLVYKILARFMTTNFGASSNIGRVC